MTAPYREPKMLIIKRKEKEIRDLKTELRKANRTLEEAREGSPAHTNALLRKASLTRDIDELQEWVRVNAWA